MHPRTADYHPVEAEELGCHALVGAEIPRSHYDCAVPATAASLPVDQLVVAEEG